jgi:hypothetical protein
MRRTRRLAAVLALLAPALPTHAQNTANQVPQAQRDAVLGGNMVFQSDEGGPFVTQNFGVYRLRYLLTKDHEPLYFSYRINGANVTYRVAWMAEPSFAYRNLTGGIPMPIPPFFQQYRSEVFAMGIALGQSDGSSVPSTTSWLPIAQLKLRSQP